MYAKHTIMQPNITLFSSSPFAWLSLNVAFLSKEEPYGRRIQRCPLIPIILQGIELHLEASRLVQQEHE